MTICQISPEQAEYQKLARDFAQKEIAPLSARFDASGSIAQELIEKTWQTGLVNVQVGEEEGGLALKQLEACLIAEELAAACSGIASAIEATHIAQLSILLLGNRDQRQTWLAPLTESAALAGYAAALFARTTGDALSKPILRKKGGADYILNGSCLLANGESGSWFVVASQTSEERSGLALHIVPADRKGLSRSERLRTIGRRAGELVRAELKDVKVSEAETIHVDDGDDCTFLLFKAHSYCYVASGCAGVSRAALEHATRYSQERYTFGVPISQHQAVAFMLADMAREIEATKLITWQAAYLCDRRSPDAFLMASKAKLFAQESVMRITTDAVQVFGGYGYSREYPVEKLMRDAKAYQICCGDNFSQAQEVGKELVSGARG